MDASGCVVLVPYRDAIAPACEDGLRAVERAGYAVRRAAAADPLDLAKSVLASDALADGFTEIIWIHPDVGFDAGDLARLRRHPSPLVCALLPEAGAGGFACEFAPDAEAVTFGHGGGLIELPAAVLGFALVRKEMFDRIQQTDPLPECDGGPGRPFRPWFLPTASAQYRPGDYAFCDRAARAGVPVRADTTIRLTRFGPHGFTWEDAIEPLARRPTVVLPLHSPAPIVGPPRNPLRPPAGPLSGGFPKLRLYVRTYPANRASLAATLASLADSDWGELPTVIEQPPDLPVGPIGSSETYRRMLARAIADGVDFAVLLEDDVRVNRHLRHNLSTLPLIARDQCDYLGLFLPDVIADPWERAEPPLGYRLARPRYTGPTDGWPRNRVWGSQGYVLSARLMTAVLDRWASGPPDGQVLQTCRTFGLPLWYTDPCLVEHAPVSTAFGTPPVYAPDFDAEFRLTVRDGFQPPEMVPGWLTRSEAERLWKEADGQDVLEFGPAAGRATVCLTQSARRVTCVNEDGADEAVEWVRRFGRTDRVEFLHGDATTVAQELLATGRRFGLIVTPAGGQNLPPDALTPLLAPGGRIAVPGYPDPRHPDLRQWVNRAGWRRVGQTEFLGLFVP